MTKSPAFRLYPKDLLGDVRVAVMDNRTFGVYFRLLCYSWEGPLPKNEKVLAKMVHESPRTFEKMWPDVRLCFSETDKGLVSPRLEEERVKQQLRSQQLSEAGKKSASLRQAQVQPKHKPKLNDTRPSLSFSSSSTTKKTWLTPFGEVWTETYDGEPPYGRLGKALKPLVAKHGDAVLPAWKTYCKATEAKFASAERFAQTYGAWKPNATRKNLADLV